MQTDPLPAPAQTASASPRPADTRSTHDPRALAGALDIASWDVCWGWAWSADQPDQPADIDVRAEGRSLFRLAADIYRPDLVTAGMGDGRHGFHFRLPRSLFAGPALIIEVVVAATGQHVLGSPALLCEPGRNAPPSPPLVVLEQAAQRLLHEAATPREAHDISVALLRQFDSARRRVAVLEGKAGVARERLDSLGGLSGAMREAASALLAKYPVLHLPHVARPDISIVIPARGRFDLTYRCIECVLSDGPPGGIEIVLVDDGSTDETLFASLVLQGAITILRRNRSEGFVAAVTDGCRASRGRFLLLLNNDTELRPGALGEMRRTFAEDAAIGVVGAKLLHPDGKLQEAGGILWRLGDAWNWGRGQDPDQPGFMHLRDADYVSGAALMIERALFEQVGGLSPEFAPGYYEDADLCFKVRAAGRRVVVQPHAVVMHHEGASAGRDIDGDGMKRFQRINHRRFAAKWAPALAGHRLTGEQPERECERLVTRQVLFIDDRVPTPDRDAGSLAAFEHMRSFQRLGYKVTQIGADMNRLAPYTDDLERVGIHCLYAPYFDSVEQVIRRHPVDFDVVYLYRLGNAAAYLPLVRQRYPKARVIFSVCDLHALRAEREQALGIGTVNPAAIEALQRLEWSTLAACDQIVTHSSHEAALIARALPTAPLAVIGWPMRRRPEIPQYQARSGIAFVGGYAHPPNVDAAEWLVETIMPLVWQHDPSQILSLIGANPPASVRRLAQKRVLIRGHVPDLDTALSHMRLSVAPLRYGAGVKGKVLSSFAAGIPCVLTPCAAEGLDLPEPLAWCVAQTPEAFAETILRVLDNEDLSFDLSQSGFDYLDERFDAAQIDRLMQAAACTSTACNPAVNPNPATV